MRSEVTDVKHNHDLMYSDIDALAEKIDSVLSRCSRIDDELDKLESFSRRDNIILYGVPESDDEKSMSCKEKVITIFNDTLKFKTWQPCDIHRAHRLGMKRQDVDKPRPVIVKLMV